jgi:REP element-mobilizing transposase RayT
MLPVTASSQFQPHSRRHPRGYYVSTVGRDEQAIREYIKNQEEEDKRLEQLNLWR